VADSITPPSLSGRHNTTPPSYNTEKAKTLLAEAGYPGGKGLPELNFTYHDRTFQKRLVESIRDDLAAVNIKVKLVHADEKLAIPYVEGVSDFYRTSWVPDYLDIDAFIQPILYSITSPRVKNLQISLNGYPMFENVMLEDS